MYKLLHLGLIILSFTSFACGDNLDQETAYSEQISDDVFTIALLPDTQGYSQFYPAIWKAQTQWLADNATHLNLQMTIHLGDLVEGSWVTEQWNVAQDAMGILNTANLPFIIAPGNHDYGEQRENNNAEDRSTRFNTYFPLNSFQAMPTFGGVFPGSSTADNSYHRFEVRGEKWLILALEFGPRNSVVEWADTVITNHPKHHIIIATHAYLYSDNSRYDWKNKGKDQPWNPHSYGINELPGGVNDGQELWDKLIYKHANIVLVVGGHVLNDGLGFATSQGVAGPVQEMLVNYQMKENAGNGYLRTLQFDTNTRRVSVRSYSPWLDSFKTDPDNEFDFTY